MCPLHGDKLVRTFYVKHAVTFIKALLYCSLIVEPFDTRLFTLTKTPVNKPNTRTQIREYFLATLYLVMKIHAGIPVSRHAKTRLPHRPPSLHSSGERGGGGGGLRREHFEQCHLVKKGTERPQPCSTSKEEMYFRFLVIKGVIL
jgi:hypothetical protein